MSIKMTKAQDYLDCYWDGRLPVEPRDIASAAGVRVIADGTLANDRISGRYEVEGGVPTIRYNEIEPCVRQRFTIAHELGHHAGGHGLSYRDPAANFSSQTRFPDEVAANRFAAELLMPADAVRAKIRAISKPTLAALADCFGVSQAAMQYRLINMGLLRG
ncbi:ImmA/IrrE family metallo-endopeptidase [Methylolobus aquaticus]